jgi:hypothetical protein
MAGSNDMTWTETGQMPPAVDQPQTPTAASAAAAQTSDDELLGVLLDEVLATPEIEGTREDEERRRRNDIRRETYVDVLRQFLVEVQIVDRRENPESSREAPEMPPELEWRDLRARVGALGSKPVNEAVEAFDAKVREFHEAVELRASEMGRQPPPTRDVRLKGLRGEVREAYERVHNLIREELDSRSCSGRRGPGGEPNA